MSDAAVSAIRPAGRRPCVSAQPSAARIGVGSMRRTEPSAHRRRNAQRHLSGAARSTDGAADDRDAAARISWCDAVAHQTPGQNV